MLISSKLGIFQMNMPECAYFKPLPGIYCHIFHVNELPFHKYMLNVLRISGDITMPD